MADGAFLDTGGLLAALNKDDDLHESATAVLRRLEESGRQVVTTNFVLAEVGNGLARTALRPDTGWLIRKLHSEPRSTVVYIDQGELFEGLELYTERSDKSWDSWTVSASWSCTGWESQKLSPRTDISSRPGTSPSYGKSAS